MNLSCCGWTEWLERRLGQVREMGCQKGDRAQDGTLGPRHDLPTRYLCAAGSCFMECTSRAIRRHQKYHCHRGSEIRHATCIYSKQDLCHVSGMRHAYTSHMIFHRKFQNFLPRIPTRYLRITSTSQSLEHIHPNNTPSSTIHKERFNRPYKQRDITWRPSW